MRVRFSRGLLKLRCVVFGAVQCTILLNTFADWIAAERRWIANGGRRHHDV